ncbi:MAG: type II secretion system GspH family protein [Proteobacteria bacterium]|nr:type II secretion system GspH family protein [Pseudomonadota bacterium]
MKSKKAFSLIELAIVILVVGILIAGIFQGRDLVSKMRLQTARSLTKSSPVNSIKDLTLWLETTSVNSFDLAIDASDSNSNSVGTWYDISPYSIKYNSTAPATTNKPKLTNNAIKGLPALLFDGTNDILNNTTLFTATNISAFVVATNDDVNGYRRIISGYVDQCYYLGLSNGSNQFTAFYGNITAWVNLNATFSGSAPMSKIPKVYSATMSGSTSSGYINGTSVGTSTQSPGKTPCLAGYSVGSFASSITSQPWKGYIAEIILINRAVTTEERRSIENYLGQKWGIQINN